MCNQHFIHHSVEHSTGSRLQNIHNICLVVEHTIENRQIRLISVHCSGLSSCILISVHCCGLKSVHCFLYKGCTLNPVHHCNLIPVYCSRLKPCILISVHCCGLRSVHCFLYTSCTLNPEHHCRLKPVQFNIPNRSALVVSLIVFTAVRITSDSRILNIFQCRPCTKF